MNLLKKLFRHKHYFDSDIKVERRIIDVCKKNDIAISAVFEYFMPDPDCVDNQKMTVITNVPSSNETAAQKLRYYMNTSDNNLDLFLIKVKRDKSLMEGNSSAFLRVLETA